MYEVKLIINDSHQDATDVSRHFPSASFNLISIETSEVPTELTSQAQFVWTVTVQAELESFPLSWITKTKAVLDSCAYNSLLILTVEERNKRLDQIYMFQCEETEVSRTAPPAGRGDDSIRNLYGCLCEK